jgi:hypothetical protein
MKKLLLVIVTALLAGCSSTKVFHSAFDDITQDTRSTPGDFSTYRQLITLNGLMPMHAPGMLFYEPTSSLPEWMQSESPALLVGISPKRSMVVEARYDAGEAPEASVEAAQKSYQAVRAKAVAAVAARLRVAMFDALSKETDENKVKALKRTLNLSEDTTTAQIEKLKSDAVSSAELARTELDGAQADFSSALTHNVVVARWTKKEDFHGMAKLADLIGLSSGRQFEESGVLILAGIRVLNTFFGEDLFCMARNAKRNPGQWEHMKRVSITVNMIQASAVGYVSDLDVSHTLALSLDMSKDQLAQLFKDGLLEAAGTGAKYKAEALVASAMGVSNFGRMVKPQISQHKTRFYPAARQVEELEEELRGAKGHYVTVSVTRAQFTEQMLEALAAAATDTVCNEELEPDRSLMETVARTRRRIEMSVSEASNLLGSGKSELPGAPIVRAALNEKLASTRAALQGCEVRIAEIDRDVTDAIVDEMVAPSKDRDARRYRVRVRKLEREEDSVALMDFLNGVSNELRDVTKELRAAAALGPDSRQAFVQVLRVAQMLGPQPQARQLAESDRVITPTAIASTELAKGTLALASAPTSREQGGLCKGARPSRR